jgi:ribosome-associated protein
MRPSPATVPEVDEAAEQPSKTRRKQASHDLQDLGVALAALSDDRIAALPIDERLRDAVLAYRRTRSHEGRRRQMQFVGKLMRTVDVEPIRRAVEAERSGRALDAAALHEAERWRAALIADDAALTRWTAAHPGIDTQQLRGLVRNARRDAALAPELRSGRAYRELFRHLREQLSHD